MLAQQGQDLPGAGGTDADHVRRGRVGRAIDQDPSRDAARRRAPIRRARRGRHSGLGAVGEEHVGVERHRLPDGGRLLHGVEDRSLRPPQRDVVDVDHSLDGAPLDLLGRERGQLGLGHGLRVAEVREASVAGGYPPGVLPEHPPTGLALDGDRAYDRHEPGVEDALHLHDLVAGTADEHVEADLHDRRSHGLRVPPVAHQAGPVAGELVVAQRDAVLQPEPEITAQTVEDVGAEHAPGVVPREGEKPRQGGVPRPGLLVRRTVHAELETPSEAVVKRGGVLRHPSPHGSRLPGVEPGDDAERQRQAGSEVGVGDQGVGVRLHEPHRSEGVDVLQLDREQGAPPVVGRWRQRDVVAAGGRHCGQHRLPGNGRQGHDHGFVCRGDQREPFDPGRGLVDGKADAELVCFP